MDNKESGFSVVISVHWEDVEERIRLDYGPDSKLLRVSSNEYWGSEDGWVTYRPQLRSSAVEDGRYTVEMAYLEQDHADFPGDVRDRVYWGTTRLSFQTKYGEPTLEKEDVRWTGDGSRSVELDGSPWKVTIRSVVPSELKEAFVKVRAGQGKFKEDLLRLEKQPSCAVSGETTGELLDAAHIISVAAGGSDEIENGLLLRADIHRLFDAGYFEINLDGSLEMNRLKELPMSYREYFEKWSAQKVKADVMQRIHLSLKRKLRDSRTKKAKS